jgi:hypothetical protein
MLSDVTAVAVIACRVPFFVVEMIDTVEANRRIANLNRAEMSFCKAVMGRSSICK